MPTVNRGVVPPGGWNFPAGENYSKPILAGSDFDGLTEQLLHYRVANSIDPGNPEADITDYICGKWPHFCQGGGPFISFTAAIGSVPGQPATFLQRIVNWIAERYGRLGAYDLVTKDEADRRANICIRCPQNVEWKVGCPPCVQKADRDLLLLRKNQVTQQYRRLRGCRAAGHVNETAVWMPAKMLEHRKGVELPDFCWMRTLKEI